MLAATILCATFIASHATGLHTETSTDTEKSPIHKIVGMLQDMQSELEKERETEKDVFKEAMCICQTGEEDLKKVIDHSNKEIPRLTAKIDSESKQKSKLESEVEALSKDKAETESAIEQATSLREKEHKAFVESDKMQKFSISQLDEAVPLLEGKASAAAFLQASPTHGSYLRRVISVTQYLKPEQKDTLLGFLDTGSQEPSAGTAQIVGIMKAMKDEMVKDNKAMNEEEVSDHEAFNELKAAKTEHLGILMKTLAEKEKLIGDLAMSLSQDQDALEDAEEELRQGTKYLATLQEACEQRRKDRDARAKMRDDEIAAISEAIKILTDDEAMDTFRGVSKIQGTGFAQQQQAEPNFGAAFVQIKARPRPIKLRLLQSKAQNKKPDPKGVQKHASAAEKVVGFMIDNMVETLHDDDVNDEHKKDFCANETASFHQLQEDKEALHEKLEGEIAVMMDEIEQLKADIKLLEEQINTNDQNVLTSTKQRKEEHFTFTKEYQAMDTAVQLIDKAANRLNQFYNPKMKAKALTQTQYKTATALQQTQYMAGPEESSPAVSQLQTQRTPVDDSNDSGDSAEANYGAAFIQTHSDSGVDPVILPTTPQTYEKKESGGVLGLMNEMKTDLLTDMKEAEMEEKHASIDYVREMGEAKDQRAADVQAKNDKEATLAETEGKLVQAKQLNELTIEEIAQIKIYLTKLHIECDFLMRNYENRHESRVDEEVGLETAETIVTHDEPPNHLEAEKAYEEEHSKKDVDEHFPQGDIEDALGH